MRQKTNEQLKAKEERVWRYVARFLSVADRFRAHARTYGSAPPPAPEPIDWTTERLVTGSTQGSGGYNSTEA
jgi:hypothetical protein